MKTLQVSAAEGVINKAVQLQQQERYDEALVLYHQAVAADPAYALAYYNRGTLYHLTYRTDLMLADFQQALMLDANDAHMWFQIGKLVLQAGKPVESIKILTRAIELAPNNVNAWLLLADSHYVFGNMESAGRLYEHLTHKFPNNTTVLLADALFVPQLVMSRESVEANRARIKEKTSAFLKAGHKIENPLQDIRYTLFYLYYQGESQREMAEYLGKFFQETCPKLDFVAPHCKATRKAHGDRLCVGIVSPSMHQVTLNQFFLAVIERLQRHPDFEVVVFSPSAKNHPEVISLLPNISRYVQLPMQLEAAQHIMADERMDILVYLEVGAHQLMSCLPFARLAPVQAVWGGFPVTTGIPNMDYFLSSRDVEPDNAQESYTEKLILRERVLGVFTPPEIIPPFKTREQLGLPSGDVRLYTCPVQLFKLHSDMDQVFSRILAQDDKALIVLFDSKTNLWQHTLRQRFAMTMPPEQVQRIVFVPTVSRADFLHVLKAVDVVMDSFHFSFGTTACLAIAAGVPFVTWPGPYFSGRASWRMFNQIGAPELIAPTHDAFVEIALKLAKDKEFYQQMSEKLQRDGTTIFNDYEGVDDFAICLNELYYDPPVR